MSNVIPFPGAPDENDWDYDVPIRDVPKVILSGLRSAGVKAHFAKVWRGKYPTTLDLLIDVECPWAHLSRDGMSFAKTRLLVGPRQGTLTVERDEESGCPHCDQLSIDRWLATCHGHHEGGHPDHNPGWISVDDFPDDTPDELISHIIPGGGEGRGDDSPMGHVFEAMMKAEQENRARWALAHPEQVAEQLRETFTIGGNAPSEKFVQRQVAERMERAKVMLRTRPKQVGSTEVVIEEKPTVESVVEWLVEQDVPAPLGVNAAWDLVKNLPGSPTQALVREAQAKRKAGGG